MDSSQPHNVSWQDEQSKLVSAPVGDLLAFVGVGRVLEHEQGAAAVLGVQLLLALLARCFPSVLLLLHVLQQQRVLHACCSTTHMARAIKSKHLQREHSCKSLQMWHSDQRPPVLRRHTWVPKRVHGGARA